MANPTTNFGWVMPTSSSLVTNLPADFNTFGQAVDTSMSELLGGTTGQVLSKTSNTNMDFTWVTPTDQTPLTTKGDLFTFTTVDARLGVGTNGQILTADSTAATGLKWATAASSGPANGTAYVATLESTSSTSYTNLTTSGPATTVTTGTKALVIISAEFQNGASFNTDFLMSVDISGATTLAASDAKAIRFFNSSNANSQTTMVQAIIYTGLTAGSNVFTSKYKAVTGTGYYKNRYISVVDMGS